MPDNESYKLNGNYGIIRESDGANIPIDENNKDYQAYLKWSELGNIIPTPSRDYRNEVIDIVSGSAISDEMFRRLNANIPESYQKINGLILLGYLAKGVGAVPEKLELDAMASIRQFAAFAKNLQAKGTELANKFNAVRSTEELDAIKITDDKYWS